MQWQQAHQYAKDVVAKKIPACLWVIKACQRYLNDHQTAKRRGLVFDQGKAQQVLDFFTFCPHIKGELAGKPIALSPWQGFVVINLFGWVWQKTKHRRFKSAYIEVARKNGKSTFAAPIALYMTAFDEEGGSEVYSAATSRDQARIVFDTARDMVRRSELNDYLEAFSHSISHDFSASCFKPLAADSDTLEGKNTHCAVIDELHAHKNRTVYDVLELSCAARTQPLLLVITTAGSDRTGICYEVRSYLTRILEGVIQDDTCFGVIYTLDNPDQWTHEPEWIKANPNLGLSVQLSDMQRLCQKAMQTPAAANQFKTKRLNIWCQAEAAFYNLMQWDQAPALAHEAALKTLPCFGGLDLSSKLDLSALLLLFDAGERHYHVKCYFWLPESVIDQNVSGKARHMMMLYKTWADQGLLTLTPGNIIDYRVIRDCILQAASNYQLQELAFDPYGATQLALTLEEDDGIPMVEVTQTVKHMSEAMKESEALIIDQKLHHGHHPVLTWMASNVIAKVDKHDNVFPNKAHFDHKIDGIIALIMALYRAMQHRDRRSVYDDKNLLIL